MSVPVALAVVIMALAAPARAGVVVGLDPTGGGGANPANTINATQLTWAPGNVLAIGAVSNGAFNTTTPVTIEYQALLQGINGTTQTGGTVAVVGQQNDTTPANGGDIVLGGVSTGRELFITASFQERIASPAPGTLTFSFAPGAPNTVTIYDAPAGTFKNFAGLGSSPPAGAIPILTGSVIPSGAEGNYGGSFTVTSTSSTTPLNNYPGDTAAQAFWAGTHTVSGSGSTFVPVKVNSVDPAFLQSTPPLIELSFSSISSALPFNSVEPSQMVNGIPTSALGPLNGFSGPDVLFQAQASNDFLVPEPSSIIPALTAATMIPSFLYLRYRRSRKTDT
jgi:hypothetical protein